VPGDSTGYFRAVVIWLTTWLISSLITLKT